MDEEGVVNIAVTGIEEDDYIYPEVPTTFIHRQ